MKLITLLIAGLMATATAQVARQGDPDVKPIPTAFRSPMVLEVPFALADRSRWGNGWQAPPEYIELGKYSVDNVSIRGRKRGDSWAAGLRMQAHQRGGGTVDLEVALQVVNPKTNHDKSVTVFVDFLRDTTSLLTGTIGPFGAEDHGLPTPIDSVRYLRKGLSGDLVASVTTLKLTIMTRDW
jgi:hypothetical protein